VMPIPIFAAVESESAMVDLVLKQTCSVRDAKGFGGLIQFYVKGTGADAPAATGDARTKAKHILDLISPLTNAAIQHALGPFQASYDPKYGDSSQYEEANFRLELFGSAGGSTVRLGIPCPALGVFLADNITPDLTNTTTGVAVGPGDSAGSTWGATHGTGNPGDLKALADEIINVGAGLVDRHGNVWSLVYGAQLRVSKTRRRFSVFTRNPGLTGPGL